MGYKSIKKFRSALISAFKTLLYPFRRLAGIFRRVASRKDLPALLANADPRAPFEVRTEWLENVLKWVRTSTSLPHDFDSSKGGIHNVRIRFILHLLERNQEWKSKVAQTLQSILVETSLLELFCRTGLIEESGFFSEIGHRLASRFFPAPPRRRDFSEIFLDLFSSPTDADWVEKLPQSTIEAVTELISFQAIDPEQLNANLKDAMVDARIILGANVFSISLTAELRQRLLLPRIAESPFYRLEEALKDGDLLNISNLTLERINDCRKEIKNVFSELEKSGVSVTLVHRLEQQQTFLRRIESLTIFLSSKTRQPTLLKRFISDLIHEHHENRTLTSLVKRNLYLLSRKIVERAGASGEHYITTTRTEYFALLRSAIGGGIVTIFTTVTKLIVTSRGLPLFFEGLFSGINYAGSFLIIQLCHFTLATKQPSATAAALAGKLPTPESPNKANDFATEVSRIHRSQFISVVGNVGSVVPGTILFDSLFYWTSGHHLISEKTAHYVIHSLHPLQTLTIWYAVLTGGVLWFSSIIAGWGENWSVYRRIPEAIAEHRQLTAILGKRRCRQLSQWFLQNVSGFFGNISLGFLLSFTPIAGRFFGLPLDIRHITLSSGALALACSVLFRSGIDVGAVGWAVAGIVCIGLLNVFTAFTLALLVAAEARKVNKTVLLGLLKSVWKKFKAEMSAFFWPSSSEE